MAVDADRCHGIEELCKASVTPTTDVVLLDDAFQHRHVKAGVNILLVDYNRMITEDTLLPAGRMREPLSGKERAHIVIITKCPKDMKQIEYGLLKKHMDLYAFQQLYYTTLDYGKLRPLFNGGKEYNIQSIHPGVHILLVTGIASPQTLVNDLSVVNHNIHTLAFGDHHDFTEQDMLEIEKQFFRLPEGKRMIITTEKDAVRMVSHPMLPETIKPYIYVLPIEIVFLQDQQETFNKFILDYVRKNSRNRRLFEE